jgi:hypothetical protein
MNTYKIENNDLQTTARRLRQNLSGRNAAQPHQVCLPCFLIKLLLCPCLSLQTLPSSHSYIHIPHTRDPQHPPHTHSTLTPAPLLSHLHRMRTGPASPADDHGWRRPVALGIVGPPFLHPIRPLCHMVRSRRRRTHDCIGAVGVAARGRGGAPFPSAATRRRGGGGGGGGGARADGGGDGGAAAAAAGTGGALTDWRRLQEVAGAVACGRRWRVVGWAPLSPVLSFASPGRAGPGPRWA